MFKNGMSILKLSLFSTVTLMTVVALVLSDGTSFNVIFGVIISKNCLQEKCNTATY